MMKKLILLLSMVLITNSAAIASHDCGIYQCVTPYDMNNKFRTTLGAVSGLNFITERKLESIAEKEVAKIANSNDLKVSIQSYSSKDLKNGIFKSMTVSGKNVLVNGIHLDTLDLKTLCDFNYIKQAEDQIIFFEDFPMAFEMTMSPDSLNKTMEHEKYLKLVESLNKVLNKYTPGLKLTSTKVAIRANKFYYILSFKVPLIHTEQKMVVNTDFKVKNGKIVYCNTKIASGRYSLDLKKADFVLNILNPLNFSVNILKNQNANVHVQDIETIGENIVAKGVIVVPKNN